MLYTRAGLEMGVAASKTFTAQVALLYLVALKLAADPQRRCRPARSSSSSTRSTSCPTKIQAVPRRRPPDRRDRAALPRRARSSSTSAATSALPVALEGALKLKEISYIPTEAYSAGEMKHGPIALPRRATRRSSSSRRTSTSTTRSSRTSRRSAPRRARDRDRDRRQRGHPAPRRRRHLRAEDAERSCRSSLADPPAPAARLPDRAPPRAERRPAAKPREDRHRRITSSATADGRSGAMAKVLDPGR